MYINWEAKYVLNKNWVTVRDKCPQINVKINLHTFLKKKFFWTDGQTDKPTDERTNRWTDGRTVRFIMPQILFEGIMNWCHLEESSLETLYINGVTTAMTIAMETGFSQGKSEQNIF